MLCFVVLCQETKLSALSLYNVCGRGIKKRQLGISITMQLHVPSFMILALTSLVASVALSSVEVTSASSPRLFDRSKNSDIFITEQERQRQAEIQVQLQRMVQAALDRARAEADAEAARVAQEAREAREAREAALTFAQSPNREKGR